MSAVLDFAPLPPAPKVARYFSYGIADWPVDVQFQPRKDLCMAAAGESQFLLRGAQWPETMSECTRKQCAQLLKELNLQGGSVVNVKQLEGVQFSRFKELLVARVSQPPPGHDYSMPQMADLTVRVIAEHGEDPYRPKYEPTSPPGPPPWAAKHALKRPRSV